MTGIDGFAARNRFGRTMRAFFADETGATAIEYALIAGGIFVAIIAVVGEIGPVLNGIFNDVKNAF